MKATIVDRLHKQFTDIVSQIDSKEISLRLTAEETFRKSLLLAAASYFESKVVSVVEDQVEHAAPGHRLLKEFVRNKAISRQYHTYFQWEENNANAFFGLFGSDFKAFMRERLRDDEDAGDAVKAFLEIGRERNRLVHQNFGVYSLEKSADEIFALYSRARQFVESLSEAMEAYLESDAPSDAEDG